MPGSLADAEGEAVPRYDYHCPENGRTVEVEHSSGLRIRHWAELCYAAQLALGETDPLAPVERVVTRAPSVHTRAGPAELRGHGFTKLVKREDGVYENVTRLDGESRYMRRGEDGTLPDLRRKVED